MSCCFSLGTLLGLLLLFWKVLYLYGAARVSLLVGFPLGAFLLMVCCSSSYHGGEEVGIMRVERGALAVLPGFAGGGGGDWLSGPGGSVGRLQLNRKNSCTLRKTWYFGEGSVSAHVFGRD